MFKIAIGATVLFALLICLQNASASDIEVTERQPIKVEFEFDQSWEKVSHSKTVDFWIDNKADKLINATIETVHDYSNKICITPSPDDFSIPAKGPKRITLTIEILSPDAPERSHPEQVIINYDGGIEKVDVTVTITYCAKIEVKSPPSRKINFGRVPHGTTKTLEKQITIKEVCGYKPVNVALKISGKNKNMVSSSPRGTITVSANESKKIDFTLKAPVEPDHNQYNWSFSISVGEKVSETITIEAYILMLPKLRLYDEKLEINIKFEPKGTVLEYDRRIDVRLRNDGDEPMYFRKIDFPSSLGGGIIVKKIDRPNNVPEKDSRNVELHVTVPYDAPEGRYYGRLCIEATDKDGKYNAGHGDVTITIVIKWPVDFIISSSSPYFTPSPLSIDFESLELKELGYEKKSADITLTEFYRYKPVRNLRFSESGEYGEWLKEEVDFFEIPPGKSRTFTLKIEPGLEAVPKSYSWKYSISAYEIGAKRIDVKAKIVPMNIPEMIEYLNSFRESPLHDGYPSSEVIISNGVWMLEVVDESEIGAEDWKKIPVLMKGTLSLLSSLNDGITFSGEGKYGKAVENLVSASVSTSTIGSNSELNNWDISGYAKDISTGADRTTEEVLINEARMLELRGWEIRRAIDYATANVILFSIGVEFEEDLNKGVISEKLKSEFKNKEFPLSDNATVTKEEGEWKITDEKKFRIRKEDGKLNVYRDLKEWENVLESAFSYQYAATIYGLLKDKEKRIECNYEESRMMDKHEELVSDATHFRIEAEKNIMNAEENDLIRIWNTYLLLNPYNYDTFSESYGSAEKYLEDALKNYKVAGESLMSEDTEKKLNEVKRKRSYILSLFFLACILYGAAFFYTINRVIMGTMAYMRDMYEREVGDIIVK